MKLRFPAVLFSFSVSTMGKISRVCTEYRLGNFYTCHPKISSEWKGEELVYVKCSCISREPILKAEIKLKHTRSLFFFFFFSGCKSVEFFCVLKGVKVLEGWYESPPVSLTQYHFTYSRPIFSLRKVYIIIAHQHIYHWDKTNNTLLTNRDSCFNPFTAKDVYFTVTKAWTCIFHTTVTDVCIVLYFLNASKQS